MHRHAAHPSPSWADVQKLANAHTVAILAFLIGAPLLLALHLVSTNRDVPTVALVARVVIELMMAVSLFRLARLLGEPGPVLWAGLALLHFMLGVLVFAILNLRARRHLAARGIAVGPLGGRVPEQPSEQAAAPDFPTRP